jgi:hypothetical protein
MQFFVIIGTFFIFISVAIVTFKYTVMTHEIVEVFFKKEKERFENEGKLFYMIGIFLEDSVLRDTILTTSFSSFQQGSINGSFILEDKAYGVRIECGSLRVRLIPQQSDQKKIFDCNEWCLEITD